MAEVTRGHEPIPRGGVAVRCAASQSDHEAGGGGWPRIVGGLSGCGCGGGGGGSCGGEGGGGSGGGGGGGGSGGGGQRPQLNWQARSTSSHAVAQKSVAASARH